MKFLTPGEKIKKLRTQLNLKQEDLQDEKITQGLISMIETNRREVTPQVALKISNKFNKKATELNLILNIDENYLTRHPKQDAELYCFKQLKSEKITIVKIDEIFEIANMFDLLAVKAKTYCKLGAIWSDKREFKESCDCYTHAKEIFISIGITEKLGYIYWKIGNSKANILKYTEAIEYYLLSQHYCILYNDSNTNKRLLCSLANAYQKSNKLGLALDTINEFLSIYDEKKEHRLYIYAQIIKAACYEESGNFDTVISICNFTISKILDSTNPASGYLYSLLGLAYCYKDNFKKSSYYFDLAEALRSKVDKTNLGSTLIDKSTIFIRQNLYTDAIVSTNLGLKYSKTYKNLEYQLRGNYTLAYIYLKLNDVKNLEAVYLNIIELLENNDVKNLCKIYNKLALIYLNQRKSDLCKKYLLLSDAILTK